jgi:hypothetical protein
MAKKNPYAVKLNAEQRDEMTRRLVEEIRAGIRARSAYIEDAGLIDFAYAIYEQQALKPISRSDANRYGEPDLTSPIGTENVDALSARAVQTIFRQEPVFMVDGDQASASKAPTAEVFMQTRIEQMRFQKVAKRGITAALVETGAVLEVCEDAEPVRRHQVIDAKILRAEDGSTILDGETGQPIPEADENGVPIAADITAGEGFVKTEHTWTEYQRSGAYVRVRSTKDFLFLPVHATDEREVFGHAVRFYARRDEVKRRYDRDEWGPQSGGVAWEDVEGIDQEREQRYEQERRGITVERATVDDSGELELWRVQAWLEVPGQDELCLVQAIVSEKHDKILSLVYDWIGAFRTVYLNPYPCPYSVWGYSQILTKLLTTIEEHTAWRNMNAKRGTLKSNMPIKRRAGSRWNPDLQPFAPDAVIDVDNADDVTVFEFEDVTAQAMSKEQQSVVDAQRIIGMNDIAIGQVSEKSRTLGENKMATTQSFVRTDDPISNIQEALEEVGWLIHRVEVESLKQSGRTVPAPARVADQLAESVEGFDGGFTWQMVDGNFTFKPRGSSDQADPNMRFRRLDTRMSVMERAAKYNPDIQRRLASPEFAASLMSDLVSETKPRDPSAFLKPLPPLLPPGMGPGGPMPGGPPMAGPPGPPGGGAPSFGADVLQQMMANLPAAGGVQ